MPNLSVSCPYRKPFLVHVDGRLSAMACGLIVDEVASSESQVVAYFPCSTHCAAFEPASFDSNGVKGPWCSAGKFPLGGKS
jgi:hypothetical protein